MNVPNLRKCAPKLCPLLSGLCSSIWAMCALISWSDCFSDPSKCLHTVYCTTHCCKQKKLEHTYRAGLHTWRWNLTYLTLDCCRKLQLCAQRITETLQNRSRSCACICKQNQSSLCVRFQTLSRCPNSLVLPSSACLHPRLPNHAFLLPDPLIL